MNKLEKTSMELNSTIRELIKKINDTHQLDTRIGLIFEYAHLLEKEIYLKEIYYKKKLFSKERVPKEKVYRIKFKSSTISLYNSIILKNFIINRGCEIYARKRVNKHLLLKGSKIEINYDWFDSFLEILYSVEKLLEEKLNKKILRTQQLIEQNFEKNCLKQVLEDKLE